MTIKREVDIGLEVLCKHADPEQTLTLQEIAEVCGVTRQTIFTIEKQALEKLRKNPKLLSLYFD